MMLCFIVQTSSQYWFPKAHVLLNPCFQNWLKDGNFYLNTSPSLLPVAFLFCVYLHNYIPALCFWVGQLLGLNLHNAHSCWISRLAILTTRLHSHFALGFVLLGLWVIAFLPRLCSRPNSCSLPSLTCSTQAPGTSQLTVKYRKEKQIELFPKWDPGYENWGTRLILHIH